MCYIILTGGDKKAPEPGTLKTAYRISKTGEAEADGTAPKESGSGREIFRLRPDGRPKRQVNQEGKARAGTDKGEWDLQMQ